MSYAEYGSSNNKSDGVVLTPQWFKNEIIAEFGPISDPCPHPRPEGWDALVNDWPLNKHNFVNPPYKRGVIGNFVAKCYEEHLKGATISLLIPSYTDTAYFHDFIYEKPNIEVRFLRGRMKFIDSKTYEVFKNALPCPLMHIIFKGGDN